MKQQALFCNHNKKFIYILIVLSSSSDFGCNWVKAGLKHNAVEEKLENIEEQVDLDKEDEITMRVFGKNANSKDPSIEVETDYPNNMKKVLKVIALFLLIFSPNLMKLL